MGWLRVAVLGSLLLGVATSAFWLAHENPAAIATQLGGTAWWLVPLMPSATLVSIGIRFIRWQYLLRVSGVFVPTRQSLSVYLGGLAMILTPAYAGEVVKAFLLRQWHGAPLLRTAPVVVAERLHDFAALILILAAVDAVALWPGPTLWALALLLVAGPLAWLLAGRSLARRGRDPVARPSVSDRPGLVALVPLLRPGALTVSVVLSIGAWLIAAMAFALATVATGIQLPLLRAVRTFVSGTIVGGLTLIPAGIGVSGSAMILSLLAEGAPVQSAALAVLLVRLSTVWFAVGVGTLVLMRLTKRLVLPTRYLELSHFDRLAPGYADQIPEHMRQYFLEKKLGPMLEEVAPRERLLAADLGCGHGWYAVELAKRTGHRVLALDLSVGQLRIAQGGKPDPPVAPTFLAADLLRLPFREASLDFAYSINAFHHLGAPAEQLAAFHEVLRVLKPGGLFFLHEMNVTNPLFRFYLGYVFPLVKGIDEGTEEWLRPDRLPAPPGLTLERVGYFTFLPDFLPRFLLTLLKPFERRLEASPWRTLSVHYLASFRKATPRDA